MQVDKDQAGRVVAILTLDDATLAISDRVGVDNAVRCVGALIEHVCRDAGEFGQRCPDAVLVDFSRYFRSGRV